MSWLPTMRIARAAWRSRQDPVGLIKEHLTDEPRPPAPQPAPAAVPEAPAASAPVRAEPDLAPEADDTHANLLLLLR